VTDSDSDNFTFEFYFSKNPFFENALLTKKYIMHSEEMMESAEGSTIQWKGENLTKKVVTKK